MSVVGDMMTGGAPGFKFEKPGDMVKGVVVEISQKQDSDFQDPTLLKWWVGGGKTRLGTADSQKPGEDPVMIPIFTLQTELNDGTEEDTGMRSIWLRGHMYSAVRDALKAAYRGRKIRDEDVIGGTLRLRFDKLGEPKPKMHPPKLFAAKFEPPSVVEISGDEWAEDAPAAKPPAQVAKPAAAPPAKPAAPAQPVRTQTDADW
jgi:hypothetical protein